MNRRLIDPSFPFAAVYALYHHEGFGYLLSSHVVQKLENGKLSLQYQGLNSKNYDQFEAGIEGDDRKLIRLIEEIQPAALLRKFKLKAKTDTDFFKKEYEGERKKYIVTYIQRRKTEILKLLEGRPLYLMGNDGYPAQLLLRWAEKPAQIRFEFIRKEEGTRYFPRIELEGKNIILSEKETMLISNMPTWACFGDIIFSFNIPIEAAKIRPFVHKKFIFIPKSAEKSYYEKFVGPLIEQYPVRAKGFTINEVKYDPELQLLLHHESGEYIKMEPRVKYGSYNFKLSPKKRARVLQEAPYTFSKVLANTMEELKFEQILQDLNAIKNVSSLLNMEIANAMHWVTENKPQLEKAGVEIIQTSKNDQLRMELPRLVIETREEGDWFDVHATVKIGEFEIPFKKFKSHILKKKKTYVLPDGSQAVIPEEWFAQYSHLMQVAREGEEEQLRLKKYQAGLLRLGETRFLSTGIEKLFDTAVLPSVSTPQGLKAELRQYQQQGLEWLNWMKESGFNGVLADDMGLGKTLQALAMLLREQELEGSVTSLIVMPTSLIYNWKKEAQRFTPSLKVKTHFGVNRTRDAADFAAYDLVFTTYGIVRQDKELLSSFPFHYVILDESQVIKNPDSKTFKAILQLNSRHRLALTGTPVENTLMDLWSQMTFLNPGFLGSKTFFKKQYVDTIEKNGLEAPKEQLRKLIGPFILRRTKQQVAKELPGKVEQVHYCEMTTAQRKLYEETKSAYRNYLLGISSPQAYKKEKFNILTGLQRLRQIAIHPGLQKQEYSISQSGKLEEFFRKLEEVLSENAKVLVFSQFVRLLQVIREKLDERETPYCYLDGGTRDREAQVNLFQQDEKHKIFLISLKAGGVGLNLTAAEYVFILDPWWNPAAERQAVDRSHRIGQKKTVFTYRFISKDTIEEKIMLLQQKKAQLSKDILSAGEDFFQQLEHSEVQDLLT